MSKRWMDPAPIVEKTLERISRRNDIMNKSDRPDLIFSICRDYRNLASALYLKDKDVTGFRENMCKAAEYFLSGIERVINGCQKTNYGYIDTTNWDITCCSLACGDFNLARKLMQKTLAARGPISKMSKDFVKGNFDKKDHHYGIFHALFGLLVDYDVEKIKEAVEIALRKCEKIKSWKGIPMTLEGIYLKDINKINEGLEYMAKMYPYFALSVDQYYTHAISVYGIALIHLAKSKGLNPSIPKSKYFPTDLILPMDYFDK